MHPVAVHGERMDKYVEHVNKFDLSSLRFPVPLPSIALFAKANNLFINVYGIFIHFAFHKQLFQIDMRICCCMNVIVYSIILPLKTLAGWSVAR